VEKTKSERGYTGTGRLITRILNTIGSTYPLNTRFLNTDEWEDLGTVSPPFGVYPKFTHSSGSNKNHSTQWGRLYEAQDVTIEWHGEDFQVQLSTVVAEI
jgi:proteasome activator subunit 4